MSLPHVPTVKTRAIAEAGAGFGIPHEAIARQLEIDPKTLRLHYADELRWGADRATFAVANTLYNIATDKAHPKCAPAAMFWLKCRAGWSEFMPAPSPRPETAVPLGKKEQAMLDANDVPEDWGAVIPTTPLN